MIKDNAIFHNDGTITLYNHPFMVLYEDCNINYINYLKFYRKKIENQKYNNNYYDYESIININKFNKFKLYDSTDILLYQYKYLPLLDIKNDIIQFNRMNFYKLLKYEEKYTFYAATMMILNNIEFNQEKSLKIYNFDIYFYVNKIIIINKYNKLQEDFDELNKNYDELIDIHNKLEKDYNELKNDYNEG